MAQLKNIFVTNLFCNFLLKQKKVFVKHIYQWNSQVTFNNLIYAFLKFHAGIHFSLQHCFVV